MKKTHLQIALEHEVRYQMEENPQLVKGLKKKTQESIIEEAANILLKDDWLWEQINERICDTITELAEENQED